MPQPQFVLKTTPPRLPRTAVTRRALADRWRELQDRTAVLVSAPRGFGKTTLLAQWRRAWLERGAFVAWLALDAQDTPARFTEALRSAVQVATGRAAAEPSGPESGVDPGREKETLTGLLAEVAALATPTVLVLDDAERLPPDTLAEAVSYIALNAPPNLHLLIGSRGPVDLDAAELSARGEIASIERDDLRLTLDDTVEILQRKFGDRISLDACVRLHEMTEGWPIGLQMAASTIERARDLDAAIAELSARRGDIERYFLESMLSQLPDDLAEFLVTCSILESMNPDLCASVTGDTAASQKLERLMRDTPIVSVGEGQGWMRLHALARDFLLGRFEQLAPARRRELHARAADWYAGRGLLREAARHALTSGDEARAYGYAATSLREIAREGRLGEAREWIARIPASAFAADVHLRLSAAWIHALGDRAADVFAIVDPIAADTSANALARLEAGIIGAAAALFCDRPGLVVRYLQGWDAMPPGITSLHLVALANPLAFVDLVGGSTHRLRARLSDVPRDDSRDGSMQLARAYGDVMIALSYIWEGRPARADEFLQLLLEQAEREAGRRSVIAAMLGAVQSGAAFECQQPSRARALLANRLDVIDRIATPDAIMIAYRTLSDLALMDGDERRALEALSALRELGERRGIPRMAVLSIAEQVRIHAVGSRPETAAALLAQLEAIVEAFAEPDRAPLQPYCRLKYLIARAYVFLAAYDEAGAERVLQQAAEIAQSINRGREIIVVKGLQAVVMHRQRSPAARAKLQEARDLAAINGLERLIFELHPSTAQILGEVAAAEPAKPTTKAPAAERNAVAVSGGLLTVKETESLRLLANGLSNKQIARSMDISDETVKWHLKNLFSKLNAGTRKHAVDRARLLGLVS